MGLVALVSTWTLAPTVPFQVILIKCASKRLQLHDSVPHTLIAISHTKKLFTYHTDNVTRDLCKEVTKSINQGYSVKDSHQR